MSENPALSLPKSLPSIRFQPWIVSMAVLLVCLLTGSFLLMVFGKFQGMAEASAQEKFELMAGRVIAQMESKLQSERRFVEVLSGSQPELFERVGVLEPDAAVPTMIASLAASAAQYSIYVGTVGGEFLQVVAVRERDNVIVALQAPAGTDVAIRRIQREGMAPRTERWQFLGVDGAELGSREGLAEYDPVDRAWFRGALRQRGLYLAEPYRFASSGELGLTIASPLAGDRGVLGVDITLSAFAGLLANSR